jgi:predicted enzyme related to lactoylglutathione lyase
MPATIDGVVFIVEDPDAARAWYADLFEVEPRRLEAFDFTYLDIGGVVVEFLQADAKSQPGTNGQVAYWLVPSFEAFVARATDRGASLYRGPIDIEDARRMAQLQDPFGNVIGIRGP